MAFILTLAMIAIIYFGIKKYKKNRKSGSLSDVINTNYSDFDKNEYNLGGETTNNDEQPYINYYKKLNPYEAGIFDNLNAKKFKDSKAVNYIFYNNFPEKVTISQIENLVNKLVKVYGKDSNKKGLFTPEDIDDINSDYWNGRKWDSTPKNPAVWFGSEENGYSMTIWTT